MTHNTFARRVAALTVALATTFGAAACGTSTATSTAAENGYNPVIVAGQAPGGSLVPQNAGSSAQWNLVWLLFDGLVQVDVKTNELVNAAAESITTDDSQHWTITLKPDQEFSDGQKVTADSFIDAWTYGAQGTNAQELTERLSGIEGYQELHDSKDTATTFSGLAKVDDLTFTVTLTQPDSSFENLLSTTAYYPLPASFFDDPEAWIEDPIGNGPYKIKGTIDKSTGAYFEVNDNYSGDRVPQNTGIYERFYTDSSASYQDAVADTIDIASATGADLLTAKDDFGDRVSVGSGTGQNQTLQFSFWDDFWNTDNGTKVRKAISLSINRQEIIDKVYNGFATPARDFTSKGLPGWDSDLKGSDVLDFDVNKAQKLLAEAGGYTEELPLYYNADGGNKQWVEAVAHQISANLGIKAVATPVTTLAEFLEKKSNKELHGLIRSGNIPFYPGLDEMLQKIYYSQAAESAFGWSSAEFDELLAKGRAQTDADAANDYYNQAQEVLLEQLPAIPLWNQQGVTVYSTKVSGVIPSTFGSGLYLVKKAS